MSTKKINQKELMIKFITLSLLFIFSGLMIFKNNLFFTEDNLVSQQLDQSMMTQYENKGEIFLPLDGATIYLHDLNINVNEITITLNEGLSEDTTFYLYNSSSYAEQYVIEQKTVRKGYKKISFYFENLYLEAVKILAISPDGSHFVNMPTGNISINTKYINIFQKEKKHYFQLIFFISIILSIIISLQNNKKINNINYKKNNRYSNLDC